MSDVQVVSPTLLVLAAGMGSRYGGLKQVVPVNGAGDAIVDYSVFDAVRAGFGKVIFVIRKDIEQVFRERVGSRLSESVEVDYAFQELDSLPSGFAVPSGRTKPWGTLQATLVGAQKIDEPFAVINADDFYGAESYRVLADHLRRDTVHSAMVGFPLRKTLSQFGPVARGVCTVSDDGRLTGTVEMTKIVADGDGARSIADDEPEVKLSGDEIVSMNMWGFPGAIVESLRAQFREFLEAHGSELKSEAYLPEAVNRVIASGRERVDVLRTNDAWCGMTYADDHEHVVQSLRELTEQGVYPDKLWR